MGEVKNDFRNNSSWLYNLKIRYFLQNLQDLK